MLMYLSFLIPFEMELICHFDFNFKYHFNVMSFHMSLRSMKCYEIIKFLKLHI